VGWKVEDVEDDEKTRDMFGAGAVINIECQTGLPRMVVARSMLIGGFSSISNFGLRNHHDVKHKWRRHEAWRRRNHYMLYGRIVSLLRAGPIFGLDINMQIDREIPWVGRSCLSKPWH
jgi:hypothetical protein